MASNLGLQIYEWVNRFARKQAMKPGKSGIMQIANPEIVKDTANEILEKFIKHGVPKEVIKTENDEYGVDIAPAKKMLEYCTKRLDATLPANKRTERDEIVKAVMTYMIEYAEDKNSKN